MNKTFTTETINGQRYQFLTLPGSNLFKFEIVNLIGSNVERTAKRITGKNVYGIAHFIEHLGFRAPKDYSTDELVKLIKNEGQYNASTDYDRINYWFKTTTDRMDLAVRLVCNYALNDLSRIPEDEFEMEKKVVFNEAKRYADDDQTMFMFNTARTACGYEEEDNVIGVPSTIDTFTLEDAMEIKKVMLTYGEQVVNVTYDPTVSPNRDAIVELIETEISRMFADEPYENEIGTQYLTDMGYPNKGDHKIVNEAEQAMTGLLFHVADNVTLARLGNAYLGHFAENSLTQIIREKNGLTYGLNLYADTIAFKPYTFFSCDVSRGDETKLIELVKSTLTQCYEDFDKAAHEKLLNGINLQRSLAHINLAAHDNLFGLALWHQQEYEKFADVLADDIDKAYSSMDTAYSHGDVKEYIQRVRDAATQEDWSHVHN